MTETDDTKDLSGTDRVVHLDTRPADLATDLRALYRPVLDEPVPADLEALSALLEAKLAAPAPVPTPAADEDAPPPGP